jgi:GalNAc-alpha-(1->4)-GalNAc-alpha-(1->3)-diNAcBac-PP-undecaprenol alpha-1,4-N-acetyl-D-galactosaminyltransferase
VSGPNGRRIALYFHRLASSGGAERMICQLAAALVDRGFRVYIISWDASEAQSYYALHPAVQWYRLGFSHGPADKFRRAKALADLLQIEHIEVLVGFVMSGDKTIYAAAKASGVRLIVAERNAPSIYWLRYSRLHRWLSFGLMHLADRITVQMPGFAAGYPSSLRRRIAAIPNPVPVAYQTARPAVANASSGRFVLLTVSRLDGVQKRIDCLIRAFARIATAYPLWDLRIIGDGPEKAALQHLVIQNGLSERIRIEPARAEIFDAYTQAHLFAISSLWEGFPNALAEALCHGLPAVGFADAAGVADLIGHESGWLAPGLDDELTLSQTLQVAMADHAERARRGEQAIRHMATFAPDVQFDRWAELLNNTAEGAKP